MEKQRSESHDSGVESHDLEIESHDSVQDHDEAISSGEPLSAAHANPSPLAPLPDPSSTVIAATTSRDSASTTASDSSPITRSCSVAHVHIHSADSGPSDAIPTCTCTSSRSNVIAEARIASNELTGEAASRCVDIRAATEAPPPVSAHQPWPVTSILSQGNTTSHCQHSTTTINHVVPTSCHGNGLTTSGGQSRNTSAHVSPVSNVSAHIQNISPVSSVSTHSHFHHPSSSVRMINSSMSSSTQQRSVVTNHQFRASRNNATPHSRAGSGLATLHGNYQCHHNSSGEPQLQVIRYSRERQREVGCSGYSPSNQTTQERYRSTTTGTHVQPHTSAIVQPWVESSHRPRPLHHVTNTTPLPRMSPQAQYNPLHVQHHQEQHRRTTHSHTERFMPYPYPRMNHHSSPSTFSPGSWSHDNHVITPVGTSGCDVEPQGRSYASSPYDLQHHPPPLGGTRNSYTSNFDYSRNYSATQGHPSSTQGVGHSSWMPYFTPPSQQNCSRNSGMMSHDSQATPPYPIQPHPHGSGSSGTSPAVWRPYSERTRSSGFCLADILSLPSDTEATPLTLDVTPPTGHHSFLVNRLLDDI